MSLTVQIESVHQFFSANTGELTTTLVLDVFGHRVEVPVVDDALRSVVEAVVSGKNLAEPERSEKTRQIPNEPLPLTDIERERRRVQVALQRMGEDYRSLQPTDRESAGRTPILDSEEMNTFSEPDPTIPKIEDPGQIYPSVTQMSSEKGKPSPFEVLPKPEPKVEEAPSPLDDDLFEAG